MTKKIKGTHQLKYRKYQKVITHTHTHTSLNCIWFTWEPFSFPLKILLSKSPNTVILPLPGNPGYESSELWNDTGCAVTRKVIFWKCLFPSFCGDALRLSLQEAGVKRKEPLTFVSAPCKSCWQWRGHPKVLGVPTTTTLWQEVPGHKITNPTSWQLLAWSLSETSGLKPPPPLCLWPGDCTVLLPFADYLCILCVLVRALISVV